MRVAVICFTIQKTNNLVQQVNTRNNISYSNPTINFVGTENVCLVNHKKLHTAIGNSYTRRYNYQNGTNKLTDIDNNQSVPTVIADFTYDVVGNQVKCGTERYYGWDYGNRVKAFYNQAGTGVEPSVYAVYLYDGGGNRTKKLVRKQGGNWASVTFRLRWYFGRFSNCYRWCLFL